MDLTGESGNFISANTSPELSGFLAVSERSRRSGVTFDSEKLVDILTQRTRLSLLLTSADPREHTANVTWEV